MPPTTPAAAPVGLQHHDEFVGTGDEGQLDLVDAAGVLAGREELDLLVEAEFLVHSVGAACLDVGAAELEPEPTESLQHAVLRGERPDQERIEVALVGSA